MKLILIILIILTIIYFFINYNQENFENNNNSIDEIKDFISKSLQSNKNLNSSYIDEILAAFNTSQLEDLKSRLSKFKEILNEDINFDKNILDDLYFDLRMNESPEVMNKLIVSYKILSDFIKNKELNIVGTKTILELTNDNKNNLIKLMKEFSKNNKFN